MKRREGEGHRAMPLRKHGQGIRDLRVGPGKRKRLHGLTRGTTNLMQTPSADGPANPESAALSTATSG